MATIRAARPWWISTKKGTAAICERRPLAIGKAEGYAPDEQLLSLFGAAGLRGACAFGLNLLLPLPQQFLKVLPAGDHLGVTWPERRLEDGQGTLVELL